MPQIIPIKDLRNTNEEINHQRIILGLSIIGIYAAIFYIVPDIIVSIMRHSFITEKGIDIQVLNPQSPLYNEAIYKEFANKYEVLLELIVYVILLIGICIPSFPLLKEDFKRINKKTFLFGLLGLAAIIVSSIICSSLLTSLGVNNEAGNEQAITDMFSSSFTNGLLLSLVTVIMAPIIEELVFRKALFTILGNRTRLALVISSLIFGSMHIINPCIEEIATGNFYTFSIEFIYLIIYSVMGLVLGLTYIKTERNVIGSIFTHMLNNFCSLIITLFSIYFLGL